MINLTKFLTIVLLTLTLLPSAEAVDPKTKYNPFTRKLDYIRNLEDTTVDIETSGTISGATIIEGGVSLIDKYLELDGSNSDRDITIGTDATGYDVKFYGATAGSYIIWDESDDTFVMSLDSATGPADVSTDSNDLSFRSSLFTSTDTTDKCATMTSNTAPSPNVVSASTELGGFSAFEAFSDLQGINDCWATNPSGTVTGWLQYDFGSGNTHAIARYTMQTRGATGAGHNRMAKDWTLEASNTGAWGGEEVVLDTVTGESSWTNNEQRTFNFTNTTAYRYFRVDVTATDGSADYLIIGEIELINTNIGTIASKDMTLKGFSDDSGNERLGVLNNADTEFVKFDGAGETLNVVGSLDVDGTSQFDNTLTVGVDDTGHDVKFYGATSGAYLIWDESANKLIVSTNAAIDFANAGFEYYNNGVLRSYLYPNGAQGWDLNSGAAEAGTIGYTMSGGDVAIFFRTADTNNRSEMRHIPSGGGLRFGATSGAGAPGATMVILSTGVGIGDLTPDYPLEVTTSVSPQFSIGHTDGVDFVEHDVDANGDYTINASGNDVDIQDSLTIGVDDTGYDVKFFGATAGSYMLWDESRDLLVMSGDATVWKDLRVPISSIKRLGFSDPDWVQFKDNGAASVGVYAVAFSNTIDEEVYFTVQMPHGWKEGSDITPHVHWAPSTAGAGGVTWGLEYTWADINGTYGNTTLITADDSTDSTSHKHQMVNFSAISNSNTLSSMLVCRIYRDVSDANDTYAADAFLLEIDFHYEIDQMGSATISGK